MVQEQAIRRIVTTNDGSNTVFCNATGQHFHSVYGALNESKHVFIEAGLSYVAGLKNVKLLEVGFGTGLNAVLSLIYSRTARIQIDYTGIELFPLSKELADQLNYFDLIDPSFRTDFLRMHESDELMIDFPNMSFHKFRHDLTSPFNVTKGFNLIYFDAFSPSVQPALWTDEVFRNIAEITEPGGVLVTYCSKGSVRRTLASVGFDVEKLAGPNGKREMIRATRL